MELFVKSVLLLGFVAITTQDITGRKGCDCSICKSADNKINLIVEKKFGDDGGGKSSCNICERRKEMLRMEREKQRQLQKCPFEILGSPAIKGKSSDEIFDEFRELLVPSQNGFFDMMRGVVKTMHVSSENEMKWAKEKEAKEQEKKKKEEEEETKKRKEPEPKKGEFLSLNHRVNPKVTVVLKQTPCGQIISPMENVEPEKIPLIKRLPKEVNRFPEDEVIDLQRLDVGYPQTNKDYLDLNAKDLLNSDLIDQLISYNMLTKVPSQSEPIASTEPERSGDSYSAFAETSTESPFVKFISNEELKALSSKNNAGDYIGLILPTSMGVEMQGVDKENAQSIDYSTEPDIMPKTSVGVSEAVL